MTIPRQSMGWWDGLKLPTSYEFHILFCVCYCQSQFAAQLFPRFFAEQPGTLGAAWDDKAKKAAIHSGLGPLGSTWRLGDGPHGSTDGTRPSTGPCSIVSGNSHYQRLQKFRKKKTPLYQMKVFLAGKTWPIDANVFVKAVSVLAVDSLRRTASLYGLYALHLPKDI